MFCCRGFGTYLYVTYQTSSCASRLLSVRKYCPTYTLVDRILHCSSLHSQVSSRFSSTLLLQPANHRLLAGLGALLQSPISYIPLPCKRSSWPRRMRWDHHWDMDHFRHETGKRKYVCVGFVRKQLEIFPKEAAQLPRASKGNFCPPLDSNLLLLMERNHEEPDRPHDMLIRTKPVMPPTHKTSPCYMMPNAEPARADQAGLPRCSSARYRSCHIACFDPRSESERR